MLEPAQNRSVDLSGRDEALYRVVRRYRASHHLGALDLEPGQVVRLRRDVSDWVERDSPGTLEAADG